MISRKLTRGKDYHQLFPKQGSDFHKQAEEMTVDCHYRLGGKTEIPPPTLNIRKESYLVWVKETN